MFGKKKNEPVETSMDLRIKNLRSERYEIWQDLEEAVRLVIIRNGVIEIYPEGADKERAIKDAKSAKEELLYEIGRFDSINNEFKIALNSTEERVTTKDWAKNVITSHEIVEDVYKKFFKAKY
jgi:hypothetical protein